MVAAEVQPEERRHALRGPSRLGQVDQEVHPRSVALVRERDRDLAADGGPSQGLPVLRVKLVSGPNRLSGLRHPAVDIRLEELQQLRPSYLEPEITGCDLPAVGSHERIGQGVLPRPGLVVVDVPLLREGGRAGQAENADGGYGQAEGASGNGRPAGVV